MFTGSLNLLRGYGHIDEAGNTELGQKSLEVEKKIYQGPGLAKIPGMECLKWRPY